MVAEAIGVRKEQLDATATVITKEVGFAPNAVATPIAIGANSCTQVLFAIKLVTTSVPKNNTALIKYILVVFASTFAIWLPKTSEIPLLEIIATSVSVVATWKRNPYVLF